MYDVYNRQFLFIWDGCIVHIYMKLVFDDSISKYCELMLLFSFNIVGEV